jgi:hypothetical protein
VVAEGESALGGHHAQYGAGRCVRNGTVDPRGAARQRLTGAPEPVILDLSNQKGVSAVPAADPRARHDAPRAIRGALSAGCERPTIAGEGMLRVGIDVQSGTYPRSPTRPR